MRALAACRSLAIIVALVLGTTGLASAQVVQTPEQAADNDLFLYYYKNPQPERLVGYLERYQRYAGGWNAFPPPVGLFAVVFREHPDWIERLLPPHLDARGAEAIDAALRLSGQSVVRPALQSHYAESGSDARLKAELAGLPSQIMDIRIATATHLDILWGAFFASGDERYVRMIIDALAQTANRSEPIAQDLARVVVAMSGGPTEIYGQVKAKYGEGLGREIAFAATAGWGLAANAQRHEKVADAMRSYMSEHPGTYATKVLSVFRPRRADAHP